MRSLVPCAFLLVAVHASAQAQERPFDPELVLSLDLSAWPDSGLEELRVRAERAVGALEEGLPSVEVAPFVLIPLGVGAGITGGVRYAANSEGPRDLLEIGLGLIGGGALLIAVGVVWAIERAITRHQHPSWRPFRLASRAADHVRAEQGRRRR